jgi:DNA-binding NarL/FixJ family response regulator
MIQQMGPLQKAWSEYQRVIEYSQRDLGLFDFTLILKTGQISIAVEQGKLEIADALVQEIIQPFDEIEVNFCGMMKHLPRCVQSASIQLAGYFLARQNLPQARRYFQKALRCQQRSPQYVRFSPPDLLDLHARLWLVDHPDQPGSDWQKEISTLIPLSLDDAVGQAFALARIELANHAPERALSLLEPVEALVEQAEYWGQRLDFWILRALGCQAVHQRARAEMALVRALDLAQPEMYCQRFMDAGKPMGTLLRNFVSFHNAQTAGGAEAARMVFAQQLLQSSKQRSRPEQKAAPDHSLSIAAISPVNEPLSQREIEVLRQLAEGKSIKEVAEELMISVNTAKTHVKNVYAKLGVHTRKEIRLRAFALGLNEPVGV